MAAMPGKKSTPIDEVEPDRELFSYDPINN